MIKVLIAEDSKVVCAGIRAILERLNFSVVGEFSDGVSVIDAVRHLKPDVILMDIGLPQLSGIEATQRIKKVNSAVKILILTAQDGHEEMFEAFAAGADGYLMKAEFSGEKLGSAIQTVHENCVWLDPTIAVRALKIAEGANLQAFPGWDAVEQVEPLSPKEREVLDAIASHVDDPAGGACKVDPSFLQGLSRFGYVAKELRNKAPEMVP